MLQFYVLTYILPFAGAVALGLFIALVARRRSSVRLSRGTRVLAAIGSGLSLIIVLKPVTEWLISLAYLSATGPGLDWVLNSSLLRFVLPLAMGLISALLLTLAPRNYLDDAGADLTPRSTFAFTPRDPLLATGLTVVTILALTIAAGLASTPDDEGRHVMYWLEFGSSGSGTIIYGWYFSLPALIALAILLGLSTFSLWRVSKPPLGADPAIEGARRHLLSTFIIGTALAAALLHLSAITESLSSTALLSYTILGNTSGVGGPIHGGTPFAALSSTLLWASYALSFAGFTIWAYIFWRSVLGASKKQG